VRLKQAQPRQVRKKATVSLILERHGQLDLFLFSRMIINIRLYKVTFLNEKIFNEERHNYKFNTE